MSSLGEPPPRPSTARLSMPPMAALQSMPRPRAVAAAFWCWLLAGVLVGATVALASTKIDPMRAEFARLAAEDDPAAAQATIDRVATASVLVVIGAGALLGVLAVVLAGVLRAGRGWARGVLTVVAPLAVAYAVLVASAVTDPMLDRLRAVVVGGLLAYAAVVLVAAACMYLPGSGDWFRRPRVR